MKNSETVNLIQSADTGKKSVVEMSIFPGEKTPWHYHTLFSETFEVLEGVLEVGKGREVLTLTVGNSATIGRNEKHYFHNISAAECIVRTTLEPGNKNFEHSLLILKGLAADGLASAAGAPRKFSDLVVFVYLSNSRMVGFQRVAEPVFDYFAQAAIRNGHLQKLIQKYCQ